MLLGRLNFKPQLSISLLLGVGETSNMAHWVVFLRRACSKVTNSPDLGARLPKSKSGFHHSLLT